MIGIVAAAALTAFAPAAPVLAEVTARDIGRLSFYAGVCSSIGWESSQERAIAIAWGIKRLPAMARVLEGEGAGDSAKR